MGESVYPTYKNTPIPSTTPHSKNTMLVNITKAASLAGIGRDTLYKNYINKGKLSTTRDERNRPMVDTSEILRVFGKLQSVGDTHATQHTPTPENTHHTPPDLSAQLAHLQAENAQLRERLEESKNRETWQREKIDTLLDTVKLLEAPKPAPPSSISSTLSRWLDRLK